MLFYHKGLGVRKTPLPLVDDARKATILREQIWSAYESDVVDVMLKCSVVTPMEIDQDGHDLTERQRGGTRPLALPCLKQALRVEGFKVLAEVIDIAEHSHELQLAHRDPLRLMLLRG